MLYAALTYAMLGIGISLTEVGVRFRKIAAGGGGTTPTYYILGF